MHSLSKYWPIAFTVLIPLVCFARRPTAQLVLEHDIYTSAAPRTAETPVLIIVNIIQYKNDNLVSRKLIEKLVRTELGHSHIGTQTFDGYFGMAFSARRLSHQQLLQPKLILDIESLREDSGYTTSYSITFMNYQESSPGHFKAKDVWVKEQTIKGLSARDIEDSLAQYIQNALQEFCRTYTVPKNEKNAPVNPPSRKSESGSYRLSWNDPNGTRPALQLGASVGTPAVGNFHLGLTNIGSLPIAVGLSGMYWGIERRGIQGEVGYFFARRTALKQTIALTLAAFNETTQTEAPNGNVMGTLVTTTNALKLYTGPAYVLSWKHIRCELGAGIRTTSDAASSVKAFFQIGYVPWIHF
ncbi:MAG: hypothetical protein HY537_14305 [Deltaproteobacteria bacterium]|nr:hypothetical protein [Deltaproteobacteria bacterium]